MEAIENVYPGLDGGAYFCSPGNYTPLLESIADVALIVEEEDYQGDSWVLFRDSDRFGYLQFGWGSCSGCDALLACDSYGEIDDLRNGLSESIRWGTASEIADYIETIDPSLTWAEASVADFKNKALALLRAGAAK